MSANMSLVNKLSGFSHITPRYQAHNWNYRFGCRDSYNSLKEMSQKNLFDTGKYYLICNVMSVDRP